MARPKKTTQVMRLEQGKRWIKRYPGKRIVHGYAKHFGVTLLKAIAELKMLGVPVSEDYEKAVKQTFAQRAEKRAKKAQQQRVPPVIESDMYIAFITGYTSGGAAYGITWEEWNKMEENQPVPGQQEELPF